MDTVIKSLAKTILLTGLLGLAYASQAVGAESGRADGEESEFLGDKEVEKPEVVHERRMAQLRHLQRLALENGRRDLISRIDGLISRELKRHSVQQKGATTENFDAEEAEGSQEPLEEGELKEREPVSDDELEAEVEAMEKEPRSAN